MTSKNPVQTLKKAEKAYSETRPKCETLTQTAKEMLDRLKIELQDHYHGSIDWDELIDSEETNRKEKIQATIGGMLEYHLKSLKDCIPKIDKSMSYVPELKEITRNEIVKGKKFLLETLKNPAAYSYEELNTILKRVELLHSEILENEPEWIESLGQYLSHFPLVEHYTRCAQDSLNPKNRTKKLVDDLCNFKHPYAK